LVRRIGSTGFHRCRNYAPSRVFDGTGQYEGRLPPPVAFSPFPGGKGNEGLYYHVSAGGMPRITQIAYAWKRYRTTVTHRIATLPIVILMPHSACNCRCVMCDIWKGNHHLQQLTEADVSGLLHTLVQLGTRQVVMSGGEALLNRNFFRFCEILRGAGMKISLLSTGLALKRNADRLVQLVDEIIVSLDGDGPVHDAIRNIPGAYRQLVEGIQQIRSLAPQLHITGRSVIHRLNFRHWPAIIRSAQEAGLDQISFLPADVSSHAFNRAQLWDAARQHEILIDREALPALKAIIEQIKVEFRQEFQSHFIAEPPEKIDKLYAYYAAFYGLNPFPWKKCNAPWVSAVIEADGTVRPCFFHEALGNIRQESLEEALNKQSSIQFRKQLDMATNPTCERCVCYLNLPLLAPR
jgi:MoaA/NifB/PqqE/SkfB family radical SAM enzyme